MSKQSLPAQIPVNDSFPFQKISKKEEIDSIRQKPLDIMRSCEMVNVLETASFDFPNYPQANKSFQVIYFELSKEFQSIKGLFNGLISFGQDGVILDFEKELSRYSLKFYVANQEAVNSYLHKIFRFVSDEIRFKRILKKTIANQKAFAREEQLLKMELFS